MRPVGAWAMSIYADHRGRKAGLTLSVSLMCLGSLLIAFAPTYAQVGLASPAILLVARVIQGLSLGGEYGSSATYLSEMAGRERRGFWSSFQYVTIIGGQLTADQFAGCTRKQNLSTIANRHDPLNACQGHIPTVVRPLKFSPTCMQSHADFNWCFFPVFCLQFSLCFDRRT